VSRIQRLSEALERALPADPELADVYLETLQRRAVELVRCAEQLDAAVDTAESTEIIVAARRFLGLIDTYADAGWSR
jgi:hypothetical protein